LGDVSCIKSVEFGGGQAVVEGVEERPEVFLPRLRVLVRVDVDEQR
jgi:hypothetical protein